MQLRGSGSSFGSGIGSPRNLLGLTLVSAVLVLGLWVMMEPSDGTVAGFPAKSCLNSQPELSPTFALCQEAEQRMREHRSGAGSGGSDSLYQSLIDRVMAAEDVHMAAYLTAVRAFSALEVAGSEDGVRGDANAAIFMLAGDSLPGSGAVRDLAHAVLGALAVRAGERSVARLHFGQLSSAGDDADSEAGTLTGGQKISDHPPTLYIAAATLRLQAEFALSGNEFEEALRYASEASAAYQAIDTPRSASLVQMELSELAVGVDTSTALTFMSRAVQYACDDDDDPSYCGFVGSWARQFRRSIEAKTK